jgi:hypothetical protein
VLTSGGLRFAFYGRMSTEDWLDPVTSRARQREQAAVLVAGHGKVVADFFDSRQSGTLPWPRRPQAAALVAALADPERIPAAVTSSQLTGEEICQEEFLPIAERVPLANATVRHDEGCAVGGCASVSLGPARDFY